MREPATALKTCDGPIVNIVGERVALGPLHLDLLPLLLRWDNDFPTMTLRSDTMRPSSPQEIEAGYGALIRGERPDWIGFAIYERPNLRPIGVTNIRDFTNSQRTAEFGISIGERDLRGRGYGTEATRLVLDFAFTALGVHNVWLDTASYNTAAIRAYAKAGFKEIGRRREALRLGDRVYDVVLMDCLATEFERPATGAIELP